MSELLPCPFCGCDPEIMTGEDKDEGYWWAYITCTSCGIIFGRDGDTEDEAPQKVTAIWNTRYERTCHPIWKRSKQQGRLTDTCECSECGGCLDDLRLGYNAGFSPYCPYCGAKVVDE